jgi:effector-binding domain-containing protein
MWLKGGLRRDVGARAGWGRGCGGVQGQGTAAGGADVAGGMVGAALGARPGWRCGRRGLWRGAGCWCYGPGVDYHVHAERVDSRPLAAIRATTSRQQLGSDIIRLLDQIWPLLREQGVHTGHNVVVYHAGTGGPLTVDVGVEAFTGFPERGEIRATSTPSGEVATVAHYGEYSDMAGAYGALEQWCSDNGRRSAGLNWEVYGDWEDDPAKRRTDVYFLLEP